MYKYLILLPGSFFEDIESIDSVNNLIIAAEYIKSDDCPARKNYFTTCVADYAKYIKANAVVNKIEDIVLKPESIVTFYDPVNYAAEGKLMALCKKYKCVPMMLETPAFLNSRAELISYYKEAGTLRQTSFYSYCRKKFNVLPFEKLSYDDENRSKLPSEDDIVDYEMPDGFPTNIAGAKKWLKRFIKDRLPNFGTYQDAIIDNPHNIFLYHSGISPMMNMGFLTPRYVIDKILATSAGIEMNNIEGFIRQVLGWREHCRLTYVCVYDKMSTSNELGGKYKIPPTWYSTKPNTGLIPLDNAISRGWKHGYLHHIERLMVIGSFMLMIGIHPNEAMKWFLHMGCDAFEWNMVNNVKIMAMYAAPGLYTTKPYISSSNYILKMSNYKKDGHWDIIWDAIYWEFIVKNKKLLTSNPRMSMQLIIYSKKTQEERDSYKKTIKDFIST
jgi:deoxyribodipyrimidine photolyase-related protein